MAKQLTANVQVTSDKVTAVVRSINELINKQVLVGIPAQNADREDDDSEDINNASLGYIHEFGSPERNIPARPFLIPGVKKAEAAVLPHLRFACEGAMDADTAKVNKGLKAAGLLAAESAKAQIMAGIPPPLAPSTVRGRRFSRDTKSMRQSEKQYLELIKSGVGAEAAQAAANILPLYNTGKLYASITSVVRDLRRGR